VKTSAQGTNSSQLGLDAIAQAFEEIARTDISRARPEDLEPREIRATKASTVTQDVAPPERRFEFGKPAVLSLIGLLLMIACGGAIVFAWPTQGSRTAKSDAMPPIAAPASISAASAEKQPATTQTIPSTAKIARSLDQPNVQPQGGPSGPAVISSEMTQRIQALERRLMNVEQGIEQIKSDQAKLARENSGLLGGLREAQEKLALRVQEFASDARTAEERAARDRSTAAEQLRGNQEQLLKIAEQLRASQEQVDQMKAAAQRRVTRLAPSQPSNISSPAKPAPKPPSPQVAASPAQNPRQPLTR
jgi:hypothetical protein